MDHQLVAAKEKGRLYKELWYNEIGRPPRPVLSKRDSGVDFGKSPLNAS